MPPFQPCPDETSAWAQERVPPDPAPAGVATPLKPGERELTSEERLDLAYEHLQLLAAAEGQVAARRAEQLSLISAVARRADDERGRSVHSEFVGMHVAGTLDLRRDEAQAEVDAAVHLYRRLPRTWQLLLDGRVRPAQADLVTELTSGLTAEQCAEVEDRLVATMPGRSTGSLRRAVRKLVKQLTSQAEQQRRRKRALDERGVSGWALPEGMAAVQATMPAGAQVLMMTALRQLARRVTDAGDPRSAQQVMSDVLAAAPGLLLAMVDGELGPAVQAALAAHGFRPGTGARPPVEALLLVPIGTALGVSTEPAQLRGHGPVAAEHARQLLLDARVRLGTVDEHGRLVALGDRTLDLREPGWAEQLLPFSTTSETSTSTSTSTSADAVDAADDAAAGAGGDLPPSRAEQAWQNRLREQLTTLLGPDAVSLLQQGAPLPEPAGSPDASTGLPLPPGPEPQYRPSRRLARLVQARDLHCIGIGCSVPSRQCDLEHLLPWPHGPTSPANLSPVSRRCHRAKQAGWRYQRHADGSTTWHAPHSRRSYTVRPDQ